VTIVSLKAERTEAIRKLIRESEIHSQSDLLSRLEKEGFALTQATLSRDLKSLKVSRVSDDSGEYFYTLPEENHQNINYNDHHATLKGAFLSLEFSGNMAVIKTLSGYANSLAVEIDAQQINEILGTIAGNDTIMIMLREGSNPDRVRKAIFSKMPHLKESL